MTVSSEVNNVTYAGNGSVSEFTFSFKAFEEDDIKVTVTDSDGVEHVMPYGSYTYTVEGENGVFESGGTVSLLYSATLAAWLLPSGWFVTIELDMDYNQPTDLLYGGTYSSESIEKMADRCVKMIQQLSAVVDALGSGGDGCWPYGEATEVTIASGIATIPTTVGGYFSLDTEGDAASDDLTALSGLLVGTFVVLKIEDDTRNVTVKHGSNIKLNGGIDFPLNNIYDRLVLQCHSSNLCVEVSRSSGGN